MDTGRGAGAAAKECVVSGFLTGEGDGHGVRYGMQQVRGTKKTVITTIF